MRRCGRSIRAPSTCCRACARCSISSPTGSAMRAARRARAGGSLRIPAMADAGAGGAAGQGAAARGLSRHFSRIVTRSARPLASITESLRKPRAGGRQLGLAADGIGRDRHAVDEPGQRQGAALGLDDDAGAVAVLDIELGAVGREGDLHGGLQIGAEGRCDSVLLRLAEALERRRQVGAGDDQRAGRRRRRAACAASTGGRRHRTAAARRRCGRRGPAWRRRRAGRPTRRWCGGRRSPPPRRRGSRRRCRSCRRSGRAWRWPAPARCAGCRRRTRPPPATAAAGLAAAGFGSAPSRRYCRATGSPPRARPA